MKSGDIVIVDECVDFEIVEALRIFGFDVICIAESNSGIQDKDVLAIAIKHEAFLITEDKDFGELVYRLKLPHHGILLLRFPNDYNIETKAHQVARVIQERFKELKTSFAVLEPHQLRLRQQ